ncbi:MAG: hypothetical protein WCC30_11190, partial [Candidatus Dormiibacterota bacterium]
LERRARNGAEHDARIACSISESPGAFLGPLRIVADGSQHRQGLLVAITASNTDRTSSATSSDRPPQQSPSVSYQHPTRSEHHTRSTGNVVGGLHQGDQDRGVRQMHKLPQLKMLFEKYWLRRWF